MCVAQPLSKLDAYDLKWEFLCQRRSYHEKAFDSVLTGSARDYHLLLMEEFRAIVPERQRVLEVGCGKGNLLAALHPAEGVGIDFCSRAIDTARQRHPELVFECCEATRFRCKGGFDYIVLSDLINDLPDVQDLFEHLCTMVHPGTRLVVNFFNHVWHPILRAAEYVGAKRTTLPQNWLSRIDVANLLSLAGWEMIRMDTRILWPLRMPLIATFLNRWLAPLVRPLCLSDFIVARPRPDRPPEHCHCTVIVPARNERGNIEAAVARIPEMGKGTEIILVEGHSNDGTWEEVQRVRDAHPERAICAFRQSGTGKGAAVRQALEVASGEICLILDADLSVPPEELPKFHRLLRSGTAELVNGVRLVYPITIIRSLKREPCVTSLETGRYAENRV